jgi:hypothetical protein
VRQRPHEEEAIKSGEIGKGSMKENSSTSSPPTAERLTSAAHDELMAALLTTDKAGLRRLVADHVIGPKRSMFVLFERCEAAHDRFTVRGVLPGTARPRTSIGVPLSLRFMADSPGPQPATGCKRKQDHSITEGNIAHVTRPRPQLLHLARRLWHR